VRPRSVAPSTAGAEKKGSALVQPIDASVTGERGSARPGLRLLLATSSVAALIVGSAPQPAQAQCYTGPFPFTNTTARTCILVTNTSFSGNVVNSSAGTLVPGSPNGITVTNSTINGQVSNAGIITVFVGGSGIIVQNNSLVTNGIVNGASGSITAANGIVVTGFSSFSGGILNLGSIRASLGDGILVGDKSKGGGGTGVFVGGITNGNGGTITSVSTAIFVKNLASFSGGITNSGTITQTGKKFGGGISVLDVTNFSGGIVNSETGSITTRAGVGIGVGATTPVPTGTFTGGILNAGSIATSSTGIVVNNLASFAGGITNSGTVNAGGGGKGGPAILIESVGTFSGDIVNTSTGTLAGVIGIDICGCVSVFAGNIINNGAINATFDGIVVDVSTFGGSIINNGTISVLSVGSAIVVSGVTSFLGGISNSGTINALFNGIVVGVSPFGPGLPVSFFGGGILNSGSVNSTAGAGILVSGVSTFAGGITNAAGGTITAPIGILVGSCGCFTSVGTFSGGIDNSGIINASHTGIIVNQVTVFQGGVVNAGKITAGSTGIVVSNVGTFQGGITNTGTVTAGNIGINLQIGGMSVFNSGTLTAPTAIQFGLAGGNTLTLGPGSNITGQVAGAGSDTFQLGGTGSASFDVSTIGSQYTGFSTFNKVDGSTWTLTGVNNTTLPWTVQQGTLIVAGGASLPNSPFTVQGGVLSVDGTVGPVAVNGGVLMGNGTLGGLSVGPGGTVAPGHSIGQLNINGSVSFTTGSFYQVETNAGGQADKIVATGAATLSGGTVQALPQTGNYGLSTTYTILTANGGRTGTFSNVTSNVPFLIPSLSYDANDVFLTLTRNTRFFQNQAGTPNQLAVASALDTFPTNNALFLAATKLTGGATQQALDRLSGEIHASVQSVMLEDSLFFRQAILGRLRQSSFERTGGPMASLGAGGPLAYADSSASDALAYAASARNFPIKAPPVAVPLPERVWWVQGIGAWGKINGDGNAADVNRNLGGVFTGFDQRFGDLGGRRGRRLHQFERQRERAGELGQYRRRASCGLRGHELRSLECAHRRRGHLGHDRHHADDRLPRLFRAGHGALQRGAGPGVRRGRLRHGGRALCGRAVRGARLRASLQHQPDGSGRPRSARRWCEQGGRRLFDLRGAGGDELRAGGRQGADPARIAGLAARLRHHHADGQPRVQERRHSVHHRRGADRARCGACRCRTRPARHSANDVGGVVSRRARQ
jgi:hypothetical protein